MSRPQIFPRTARILAFDAGGSKTDIAGELLTSGMTFESRHGAINFSADIESWVSELGSWSNQNGGWHDHDDTTMVISSSHLDLPEHYKKLRTAIESAGWLARTVITNDTYAVLRSGFEACPLALPVQGVGVTCGTGINCLGVRRDGNAWTYLAFGEASGDWGGGNDLGSAAVWHAMRAADGRGSATLLSDVIPPRLGVQSMRDVAIGIDSGAVSKSQVRDLTPALFETADRGDQVSIELLDRLADEVYLMVRVALDACSFAREGTTVVLGGAILARGHPRLTDVISAKIARYSPRCIVVVPEVKPIMGALHLARDVVFDPDAASWLARAQWAN